MTEVKKLKTGIGLIFTHPQFQLFSWSIQSYVNHYSTTPIQLKTYSDVLLKLFIITGLLKRLAEKSIWISQEYKVKISIPEAFVIWELHQSGLVNFPGDGGMMMEVEKILNRL